MVQVSEQELYQLQAAPLLALVQVGQVGQVFCVFFPENLERKFSQTSTPNH